MQLLSIQYVVGLSKRSHHYFNYCSCCHHNHHHHHLSSSSIRSQSPWFTEECKRLKTSKRLAERRYQKHKLTANLDLWRKALQDYKLCCTKAKSTYYQQKIAENSGNQKELLKVVNTLLHKKKDNRLPTFTDPSALGNKFLEFFQTKIDNIRKTVSTVNTSQALQHVTFPNYNRYQKLHVRKY